MNGFHSFTEGSDCHFDTSIQPSVVTIPPLERGFKHQLSLLTDVENAMRANNGSNDPAWKKDNCTCDESVGICPCMYCAIHDALRRCQSYFKQNVAHEDCRDVFMPRKAFEQIVQTLKDAVNDAMAYGESEIDERYEATVATAEELLNGEQKVPAEIATKSPEPDSSLPAGVSCACGIYTKTNSDLFIDRDMKPDDLRAIASHVEAVGNLKNLIQPNVADRTCLTGNATTERGTIGGMDLTSTDLLDAAQLLDDCLIRIYPEEFKKNHIEAAAERFGKANGTISRIAYMADKLRCASNKLKV
jgi:hypothetical protein